MRIDRFAERIKKINPSETLAITAKVKKLKDEGKDIVNFAAGEPDFDTPLFIKKAAKKAIDEGFTKYTPASGTPELKKLIATKFKKDNSLAYNPEQIIVSCGAKHSIFNTLMVLIDRGDEVIIPSPYWVSYPEMVNLCMGTPRFVKTLPENNFKMAIEDLKVNLSADTKLLILNSPSNPTGCVYTKEELIEIADICVEKKVCVISDEVYEKIIYDQVKHVSIASLGKEIYDLTVTINGVSKSYSMTGWRIGYLAGPPEIVNAIAKLQSHSTSNPTSISQKAAVAALSVKDDFCKKMRAEFQQRRNCMVECLEKIKKIKGVVPQGGFYIFCNISATGMNSLTFANRLLQEALVSVIPGKNFGNADYVRLSFATGLTEIKMGMARLEKWLSKIYGKDDC